MSHRIAILGAGAAGCFAAANIPAREGQEVVVFEKTGKALQKVRASGGGRCNVTHNLFDIPELVNRYPRGKQLLKKTLHRFGPKETIAWFEARGVQLKAEADGRMFPVTDDSATIVDCLWQAMMREGVAVRFNKGVTAIRKTADGLQLQFSDGSYYDADRVLIAAGASPKADAYNWLRELGHTVQDPVPSLFTFNMPGNAITELMGVSVPFATVKIAGTKFSESGPLLITHWGMSGPAVLRTSAWAARELNTRSYEFQILVNWLNDVNEADLRENLQRLRQEEGRQSIGGRNPFGLPKRLWDYILQSIGADPNTRWGDLSASIQNKLVERLIRDPYAVKGKTTFKEEFVTCGGIVLSEVDPQTMESRLIKGLHFAGEILDVDGITGGFNFQHAWASGWIAAQAMQMQ
jgi:hypothetical protein